MSKVTFPPLSNRASSEFQTKNQWLMKYFLFRERPRSQDVLFEFIASLGKNSSVLADRYRGCMLGLAIGDALGTTLEFSSRSDNEDHTEIIGEGPFSLKPGQWTDDTSMALCLAYSLLEKNLFDSHHQMQLYTQWWQQGLFSSTGECFDIGSTTALALSNFLKTGEAYSGSTDENTAGNGSLMRLAPVPLFYASTPSEAIKKSGESSKTTHGAIQAVDACRYYAGLIIGALLGHSKDQLLKPFYSPQDGHWDYFPVCQEVEAVVRGSYKQKNRNDIRSTGYVIDSMEAALWAFFNTEDFESGLIKAVNLGGDSDTVGAIYGQLAGAFYGESQIPFRFIKQIHCPHYFYFIADELCMFYAGRPV